MMLFPLGSKPLRTEPKTHCGLCFRPLAECPSLAKCYMEQLAKAMKRMT